MYELPYELRIAIDGLNNPNRQKILLILENEDKLSFSEIERKSELDKALLASHLRKLIRTLLIEHFYEHEVGNDRFSYYRISSLGKLLLQNILKTVLEETKGESERVVNHWITLNNEPSSVPLLALEPNSKNAATKTSGDTVIKKLL